MSTIIHLSQFRADGGWMDERVGDPMEGWMDGWEDGRMDGQMDG